MSNNGDGAGHEQHDEQYIDPKGYWIDAERNLRRMGTEHGEQIIILKATEDCSKAATEIHPLLMSRCSAG